ncbi:hypothetical protein VAT7223_00431 [Vibrio atlanticus]|uniref:Uncharacterized protein n=1 Tax=Vibrio atlanticus TaxID=693153 RepID=A0A1C3IHN6_9VIBR|nr:hypothetical protein VAT7223_00431 [Vibrio atlanticus]
MYFKPESEYIRQKKPHKSEAIINQVIYYTVSVRLI